MLDGDGLLAVGGVLGDVLAHAVADVQQPALVEQVGHDGGHRLGCRVDHERRLGRGRRARRVLAVRRPVAACMANRSVEHDLTVAAHAQRDRGIEATAVEALHPAPDAFDAVSRHAQRLHVGHLGSTRADRVEVAGHPDAAQRIGHQRKARDRRDRDCLQRDHGHHELANSARGAAIRCPSSVSPIRSGRSGPLARAGLGSGQLARARLGSGQLLRARLSSGLVHARLGAP